MQSKNNPVVLTRLGEDIIKAVAFYRYMTALDITQLLYSPGGIRHARTLLALLCGGGDFVENQYLYRFRMPDVSPGNPERIYTLGALGRDYLRAHEDENVRRRFRPDDAKHISFSQMVHNMTLTRFLVAARRWAETSGGFALADTKIGYELLGRTASEQGKKEKAVPDGWLLFEKREEGKASSRYPVLVEIDRGTMYRERFKAHVSARIEFVRSGAYKRMFGIESVVIAYVTTGALGGQSAARRQSLCTWTQEVWASSPGELGVGVPLCLRQSG